MQPRVPLSWLAIASLSIIYQSRGLAVSKKIGAVSAAWSVGLT